MDLSNKTLALFLVAAIVVSLAGTIISLDKIGQVGRYGPTGFVPADYGNVSIDIGTTLSIILDDALINFGSCSPLGGQNAYINSDDSENTPGVCPGFNQDNITIRNDGNVNANVTVKTSAVGEAHSGTFLNSATDDSYLMYKTVNKTGCIGVVRSAWTNWTNTSNWFQGCDNLKWGATENDFWFGVRLMIPPTVDNGQTDLNITFTANNVQ